MNHPQTALTTPEGLGVLVDVEMAPLLAALWRDGVRTDWSCQGEPADDLFLAYISFCDRASYKRALRHLRRLALRARRPDLALRTVLVGVGQVHTRQVMLGCPVTRLARLPRLRLFWERGKDQRDGRRSLHMPHAHMAALLAVCPPQS